MDGEGDEPQPKKKLSISFSLFGGLFLEQHLAQGLFTSANFSEYLP
jgi:hypothetical protein